MSYSNRSCRYRCSSASMNHTCPTSADARELARLDVDPHDPVCWLCRRADPYGGGLVQWCHLHDKVFCTRAEGTSRDNQIKLCVSCHTVLDRRWISLARDGTVVARASPPYLCTLGLHSGITRIAPACWSAGRRAYNERRIVDADEHHLAATLAQQRERQVASTEQSRGSAPTATSTAPSASA